MYEPREYRKSFSKERFVFSQVEFKETDLFVGIDKASFKDDIIRYAKNFIISLREQLDEYIVQNPKFEETHEPVESDIDAPRVIKDMIKASSKAGIGPMSTIAGVFAQNLGLELLATFEIDELVIENGGDIFLYIQDDLNMSIYAGDSPLSEKLSVKIMASYTPVAVCTSSGTVGHSHSYGKADAVMVACKNTLLADAYATAYCNKVQDESDVEKVINELKGKADVLSAVVIMNDKSGVCGKFELIVNN